jgi:tRNA(fMet)-specific endonuclease VapC
VTYLLDTDACIALINGRPPLVRERFRRAVSDGGDFAISSIVSFELWYGVAKSTSKEANRKRIETFLAGPIEVLSFDEDDAANAGEIRAYLEAAGTPIGAYDLLIAGHAMRHKAVVVTANVSEFSRIRGLVWENWAAEG